jgi:hypothetical protein
LPADARGFGSQWDVFFDQLGPTVKRVPYMTTVGNHERDWPRSGDRFPEQYDSGGECGVPYYRRTRMPTPSEDRPWYSFDFGPIHFLQFSTGEPASGEAVARCHCLPVQPPCLRWASHQPCPYLTLSSRRSPPPPSFRAPV